MKLYYHNHKKKNKLLKSNEIPLKTEKNEKNENNENKENFQNNDKNIILKLNEKIEKLKKKINILSDENINLLNEKKMMKNEIMNLQKDRQYLIEHISELNKILNNRIKPKLNENENYLMNLKNQIIEFKNKNNVLIKNNILQNEIIKDLKEELSDIYYKTTSICKNNNYNYKIKKQNYANSNKKYLSMQNIKKNNRFEKMNSNEIKKSKKYNFQFETKNDTNVGTEYNNSFSENKAQSYYNNLYKKNKNNNIGYILNDLFNSPYQSNNIINKNYNTLNNKTYNYTKNNKFNIKEKSILSNNSGKNYNRINNSYQNNYHFSNLTPKSNDINKLVNKYDQSDIKYVRKSDSSNNSFLSDYTYEDKFD